MTGIIILLVYVAIFVGAAFVSALSVCTDKGSNANASRTAIERRQNECLAAEVQ